MAKANCIYTININGKEVVFNSDMELDTFLKNEYSNYEIDNIHKTFSTDIQAGTIAKLDEAKVNYEQSAVKMSRINSDGDTEPYLKVPHSISTTSIITTYGRPDDWSKPIVTPFNLNAWKELEIKKLMDQGLTKEEASLNIKLQEFSWIRLTDYGNEIHNLAESIINSEEFKSDYLTNEQISEFKTQFNDFISSLKQKFGNNIKIYPEFAIKSKSLNQTFKRMFDGINSINGRIDLLVIDESGNAHIYDFKVSRKAVGEWAETKNSIIAKNGTWHSTKKLTAAYQMTFYKRMLEQYGINVASINVVPIQLNLIYKDDNVSIDKIESIVFDQNNIQTNMQNTNAGGKIYENIAELLPIELLKNDPVDIVDNLYNEFNKAFPDNTLSRKIQARESTFQYYRYKKKGFIQTLNEGDLDFKKGKYRFWDDRKPVYANSKEELDIKIQQYVDKINEKKENELNTLANNIELALNNQLSTSELTNDADTGKRTFVEKHFKRYIDNGWNFVRNTDLNNIGIFIFKKDGMAEIISITNNEMFSKINLGLGTNILGRHLSNLKVNPRTILDANNGNFEIMKVLFFLNQNSHLFQDVHINTVKALNIWQKQYIEHFNSIIKDNFAQLTEKEGIKNNLDNIIFNDDVKALVEMAHSFVENYDDLKVNNWEISEDINTVEAKREWLLSKIEQLKRNYGTTLGNINNLNPDDPRWVAYTYLFKALDRLMGYNYYFEANPARWLGFGPEGVTLGSFVTSIQNADSKNAREVGRIFSLYREKVRAGQLSYLSRYRQKFQDFYTERSQVKIWGDEAKYFKNWFVKNDSGQIDEAFIVKHPTDPSLGIKEKIALEAFLEIVNELKFGDNQEAIEEAKLSGEYYQVPLMRAGFKQQLRQKGVGQALKAEWKETANLLNVFQEQSGLKSQFENENLQVYNRFNIDQDTREKLINERGIADFETDLEVLLNNVIEQYVTQKVSNEFVPLIQGLKIGLVVQQAFGGGDISNLIDFVDKYLKTNLYNEPIMDEALRPAYRFLSIFKKITSLTGLGFNFKSGTREVLQGSYIGLSRTAVQLYGKDQYTVKDWLKANKILIEEAPKSIGTVHLIELLNWDYGMANAGASELTGELRINKLGLRNWGSDQMFFFSKAPDMLHRMAVLMSKMIHEGVYDAHSVVGGELIYDFKKDKRFEDYINKRKNSKNYKFQEELYLKTLEQFNEEGYDLQEGDDLPRAYTNREAAGIKNYADTCFGHYDKDTQSAMKNMFLGSFFLQFRTFITAKLEQWVMKPGVYNQENLKQQYDEEGNRLVKRYTFDENGQPIVDIIPENQLRTNDVWKPFVEWEGRAMEGIAYSMFSYIKALGKLDGTQLNALWKDDLKRANLFLFLHDMGLMLLLAALVQALFSWDELKEAPWIKKWSALALYGSFQDGPIHNIVGGMVGDLNPPAYKSMQGMWETSGELITGDKNLWDAVTRNVGALREFYTTTAIW